MPKHLETISVVSSDWTELTTGDATHISFQVLGPLSVNDGVYIAATEGATPPVGVYGFIYTWASGEKNMPLTTLGLGLTTPRRVWARTIRNQNTVLVSQI